MGLGHGTLDSFSPSQTARNRRRKHAPGAMRISCLHSRSLEPPHATIGQHQAVATLSTGRMTTFDQHRAAQFRDQRLSGRLRSRKITHWPPRQRRRLRPIRRHERGENSRNRTEGSAEFAFAPDFLEEESRRERTNQWREMGLDDAIPRVAALVAVVLSGRALSQQDVDLYHTALGGCGERWANWVASNWRRLARLKGLVT